METNRLIIEQNKKTRAAVAAYLNRKYEEWRAKEKANGVRNPSIKQWAREIGISSTNMSYYMSAYRLPGIDKIDQMVDFFREDTLYKAAGYTPRVLGDLYVQEINKIAQTLGKNGRRELLEMAKNIRDRSSTDEKGGNGNNLAMNPA